MVTFLRFLIGSPPVSLLLLGWWIGLGVFTLLVVRLSLRTPRHVAAAFLDATQASVEDRFQTWLALPFPGVAVAWNAAVRKEIEAFSADFRMPVGRSEMPRISMGLIVFAWLSIAALQAWFSVDLRSNRGERVAVADLLVGSANEVEMAAPELSSLALALKSEAEQILENRLIKPRDEGVRALSTAIAGIRSRADAANKQDRQTPDSNQGAATAGDEQLVSSEESGQTPDLPVHADLSPSATSTALTAEDLKRLARLASRLEERMRSAAGFGESASEPNGESQDGGDGESRALLDQLAAGKSPSSAGSTASDSAAPGPGSDEDFGSARMDQVPSDLLAETTGPELSARIPNGDTDAGTAFSILSRESASGSSTAVGAPGFVSVEFREESVELEDIPVGSRELVRRYFERVRANAD